MEPTSILDILNTADLTDVSIRPPLIKNETDVQFTVISCKLVPAKDGVNQNVEIILRTVGDYASNRAGVDVTAGKEFTYWISLKQVDKNGKDRTDPIKRDCTAFKLAATGSKAGSFMPLEQYVGRQVTGRVIVDKDEKGQYGDQNRIVRWIAPAGVKME